MGGQAAQMDFELRRQKHHEIGKKSEKSPVKGG
jgi:hypothetical protein